MGHPVWFQSEEAEKRSAAKPRNENSKIPKWENKEDMKLLKTLPVIKVDKRSRKVSQAVDDGEITNTMSDTDSNKCYTDIKLEKTNIKNGK